MPQSSIKGRLRRIARSLGGGSDPCLAGDKTRIHFKRCFVLRLEP
jgi:hypothetical protein